MFQSRFGRSALAACAMLSLALSSGTLAAGASTRAPSQLRLVAPALTAPHGARSLGAMSTSSTLNFSVYLSSRDANGLSAYAAAVTNTHSSMFRHYLTRGEFAARFGASRSAVTRVSTFLRREGLHVSGVATDGLALHVTGRVSSINRAFSTTITRYRLAGGAIGTAASAGISVPNSLHRSILSVIGLNNLTRNTSAAKLTHRHHTRMLSHLRWPKTTHPGRSFSLRPSSTPGAPSSCASATGATQQGYGGITDDQVAHAYGVSNLYSAGDLGAGQTVAVYELEPFSIADVQAFDQCYFGTDNTSNITTINVDGGPGTGPGSGESALDIQNVSALAPSAHIEVYQAPNSTAGALDAYGQIVADDTAKVVTTSWGLCESAAMAYSPGSLAVEHLLFEQAAAQGQSVFAAAGDSGSDDCAGHGSNPIAPNLSVDDPASQPYVVSVGGTTAISVANPPVEQVWNDGAQGGAGGGGPSRLWPMPSWQHNLSSVTSASSSAICGSTGHQQCRVTPDVAAFADEFTGITINYAGSWGTIGGTSSSAPLWAAMLAEVNASASCQANPATTSGVGFVSPLLYEVGANPTLAAQGFNDVTAGNNDSFSTSYGNFIARPGYDAATGFGSPRLTGPGGTGLAASLCQAAQEVSNASVTASTPSVGPISGGTHVTITGTGFMTGATSNVANVYFGELPAASFSVVSATSITAVTPSAALPKAFGHSLTSGSESLVAVTLTSGHVAVGPTFSYLALSGSNTIPTVGSVGPNGGPTAGGNQVTIYGSGFTGATAVTFGGITATSFSVKSDSMIQAIAPAKGAAACLAHSFSANSGLCQTVVAVTTSLGTSPTVTPLKPLQGAYSYNSLGVPIAPPTCKCELYPTVTEYDYQAAPTVSSVVNLFNSAPGAKLSPYGGDLLAVHGTGFNYLTLNYVLEGLGIQQTQVTSLGNVTFTGFQTFSNADPNPSPTGDTIPLFVNSMGGTSASVSISYGAVPKIDAISATLLPSAGGLNITITGEGLTGTRYVSFSSPFGLPSTTILKNFTVVSNTQITLYSPSLTPGSYQVSVGNAYGDSGLFSQPVGTSAAPYQSVPYATTNVIVTYPGGAAITGATGTTCSVAGGCSITITGVNLGTLADITVYVAPNVATITNYTQIAGVDTVTVTVPAAYLGHAGTYAIFLLTDNGTTPETLTALETYS